MRERFYALLNNSKQFLQEGETLVLVKDSQMIANWVNEEEELCEVHGNVNEKLVEFLNWLHED